MKLQHITTLYLNIHLMKLTTSKIVDVAEIII